MNRLELPSLISSARPYISFKLSDQAVAGPIETRVTKAIGITRLDSGKGGGGVLRHQSTEEVKIVTDKRTFEQAEVPEGVIGLIYFPEPNPTVRMDAVRTVITKLKNLGLSCELSLPFKPSMSEALKDIP